LGDAVDQAGAHPVEFGELGPLLGGLGRGPWRSWPEIPTSSAVSNSRTTPAGGHSSTRSSTTTNGSCWNSAQGCAFYGRQRGPRRRRSGVLPRPPPFYHHLGDLHAPQMSSVRARGRNGAGTALMFATQFCYPIRTTNGPRSGPKGESPAIAGDSKVELGGLEPPTSWVRSRSCFRTNCAYLLGVYRLSTRWSVQISGTVCRDLSGVWSAQTRARTSGDVPIMAASPPPRSTDAPRR
jgi:hypothetical protein